MPTRAEHRRATLRRLSDAATTVFTRDGPGATIDAIAAEAGVARRTVFRYVDSKEALAFIHPVLWFDVFEAGLAEVAGEPLGSRLRHGSRAIALHIDADPEPPRRAFRLVAAHPELGRGFTAVFQQWIDRIAAEVLTAETHPGPAERFRARIVGAATMGMVDAVVREWVSSANTSTFTALYDRGLDLIEPLLDGPPQVDGPGTG